MNRWITSLVVVASLGLSIALAEEASKTPGTASTDSKSVMKTSPKVYAPYSKLETLTPEQKTQISAIQIDAKERIKKIEEEAESKIEALLTAEQKAQLEKLEAEHKEKLKEIRDKKKLEKAAEQSGQTTPKQQ